MRSIITRISFASLCLISILFASIDEPIRVCALRVSFAEDDFSSTTGNGDFLLLNEGIDCGIYTIDPPPHNKEYFESQLEAVHYYFNNISYGKFGLDIINSKVFPDNSESNYKLDNYMNYYNPYDNFELQEQRLTEFFRDALLKAYDEDQINFSDYDIIVIFHAGIGQDFSLPFLDPTPEDIPSTYVDQSMIQSYLGEQNIIVGGNVITHGIILPESQNHLLYNISETMFSDAINPCDYQFGLTGTFALMIGFAIGLPPLWNIDTGESGIGVFGLMDQGSNNSNGIIPAPPNAWTRIYANWETPYTIEYGNQVMLPKRSENQIVKVPLRDNEYFLIENRNNYVRDGVSLDSIRYLINQISIEETYPSFIEILFDSSGIQKDENGVVTYVPNYDIGLPASGLLIWHIDEEVIYSNLNSYSINSDIRSRGIDVEEADGAQDLGYISDHIFFDPSNGYFGDMWFKGNNQYELANPNMVGLKPEFGPSTFPNTNSNDGSSTFISIEDISIPEDTMKFSINNYYKVYGFPEKSFEIVNVFDVDNDGDNDFILIKDSLYLAINDSIISTNSFHQNSSDDFIITMLRQSNNTMVFIAEFFEDSTYMSCYDFSIIEKKLISFENNWIDSLVYPVAFDNNTSLLWMDENQWGIHSSRVFSQPYNYSIDFDQNGIAIDYFGGIETRWDEIKFTYIAGIDLDLDANTDLLALDEDGILYSYNPELILNPGFPLDISLSPPILSQDLLSDNHPEIIAKSKDKRSLYIFDKNGKILFNIVNEERDSLIAINDFDGKYSIYTTSAIYQFDDTNENYGNKWNYEHGNVGRSRTINLDYTADISFQNLISRGYVYPNPIRDGMGTIRIESISSTDLKVDIFDLAGFFVKSYSQKFIRKGNQFTEWKWNVNSLESGIYFIQLTVSSEERVETKTIKVAIIH